MLSNNFIKDSTLKKHYDLAIYLLFSKTKYNANDATECIRLLCENPNNFFVNKLRIFQNCIEMFYDILKENEHSRNIIRNKIILKFAPSTLFEFEFDCIFSPENINAGLENIRDYDGLIERLSFIYSIPIIFKNSKAGKKSLFAILKKSIKNILSIIVKRSLISSDIIFNIFELILDSHSPKCLIESLESDHALKKNGYVDRLQKFFYILKKLYLLKQKNNANEGSVAPPTDIRPQKDPIYAEIDACTNMGFETQGFN